MVLKFSHSKLWGFECSGGQKQEFTSLPGLQVAFIFQKGELWKIFWI